MSQTGATNLATDDHISLREFVERLFQDHMIAHAQHQAAHEREHIAAQKAIDTAATLAKENKADANEWRDAMTDRERSFVRVDMVERMRDEYDRRLHTLERHAAEATGAVNVARFFGFGGLLTGTIAILYVATQQQIVL